MNKALFIHYPKCSTCQKAEKWLQDHGVEFKSRDIVLEHPQEGELSRWIEMSGLPVNRFFNSSGLCYKALGLKDRIKIDSKGALIKVLATEGMLVKRPVLLWKDRVLVGFKEQEWESLLLL